MNVLLGGLLIGCINKVPFVVADPPGPLPSALSAPPAPQPNEVVPAAAASVEAKASGATRLRLPTTVVGVAPFPPIQGLEKPMLPAGSRFLRALLDAGFGKVVDLAVSPEIDVTVTRTVAGDQFALDGSMEALMRYARVSKADFLLVVADARATPVIRPLEVTYNLPSDVSLAYRSRYAAFSADVTGTNADWSTKEAAYNEAYSAAQQTFQAAGGTYFNFIVKNNGQKRKDAYDKFKAGVERLRRSNAGALEAALPPDRLEKAVRERKENRDVNMTEVRLTVHVVSPPGGDLLRIVDVVAVQPTEAQATDAAMSRLIEELKNL